MSSNQKPSTKSCKLEVWFPPSFGSRNIRVLTQFPPPSPRGRQSAAAPVAIHIAQGLWLAQTVLMRKVAYKTASLLLAFASGVTVTQVKDLILAGSLSPVTTSTASNSFAPSEQKQSTPPTGDPERPSHFYLDERRWNFKGYVIVERSRRARWDYGEKPKASAQGVDVSYIAVERGSKVLAKFDADVYFGLGNSANFAPFPFLGSETQQLFISQDIFRGGRQWIVSLSPRFRIIFDGYRFSVGREGYDLGAIDLDKDGMYEIIVPLTCFYGFANLSPASTPLPTIVFKYNVKSEKYLPANVLFREYLLRDVDKQKAAIKPAEDQMGHLSDILSITLDYLFAGEEREAWTFFDESYKLPDRKKMKAAIRAEIKNHPVYRFIYKKTAR
jgi:hypothetical protein